jgi:putative membrane protein
MTIRWLFAAVHLLALGIGLGAVWARARALRGPLERAGLAQVFVADNWWAAAAALWVSTGLVRLVSSLEKGSAYYLHNSYFLIKMSLFVLVLVLEVTPIVTLIRWRAAVRRGATPDLGRAAVLSRISAAQALIVVVMVLGATAMARGLGAR